MELKKPHIGKKIEARIEEVGITKAELARRIKTSRQNLNTYLRSEHLSTKILIKFCEALDYNFFQDYTEPDFRDYLEAEVLPGFIQLKGVGLSIQLQDLDDFLAFTSWWTEYKRNKYEDKQ